MCGLPQKDKVTLVASPPPPHSVSAYGVRNILCYQLELQEATEAQNVGYRAGCIPYMLVCVSLSLL